MFRRNLTYFLIFAMVIRIFSGILVSDPVWAAENEGLVIEVTTVTSDGVESTQEKTGTSLENALSGMTYPEITGLKIVKGTLTKDDWQHINSNNGNSSSNAATGFSNLNSFLVEDGVTSASAYASTLFPKSLEIVTLPEGITIVGGFMGCSKLETVNVPETVESIQVCAFYGCSSLKNIFIHSERIKKIGNQAFYKCSGLSDGLVLSGVTEMGVQAFAYSSALKKVSFSEGAEIGDKAFYNCTSVEEVSLPQDMTILPSSMFYGCQNLRKADISQGITVLPYRLFYGCESLQKIDVPEGVTMISEEVFYKCHSLAEVNLPDGLTTIGLNAFYECLGLKEITIPASITELKKTFLYCRNLERVNFLGNNITTIGEEAFLQCNSLKEIVIPDSVTQIGFQAFWGCSTLKTLTIPASVKKMQSGAFLACMNLREVTLPDGILLDNSDVGIEEPTGANARSVFGYCPIQTLNIVLKGGESTIDPVKLVSYGGFSVFEPGMQGPPPNQTLFFYTADGKPLDENTTPTLAQASKVYLAVKDGNTEDDLWYEWEIGYSYPVENQLQNLATSNQSIVWKSSEGDYKATLDGDMGGGKQYQLPETIHVMIGEREAVSGSDYTYDPTTGELVIFKESIDGKIVIKAQGTRITYNVTVRTDGEGTASLQTDGTSVITGRNSFMDVEINSGDTVIITVEPDEGYCFQTMRIDGDAYEIQGQKIEGYTQKITYTIYGIKEGHTVHASFKKIQEEPVKPTQSPTPPPASPEPMKTFEPTASPEPPAKTEPTETLKPSQTPKPSETPVPDKDVSQIADGLGVSTDTAVKIQTVAKELDVSMDTILVTEQTITSQKTDDDLKGAYFARIQARASQITENNIKLSWNRVKGADGYEVYGNRCNTRKWIYEYKKIKTIENAQKKSHIERKCKKGTYYKYMVRAYKIIDGKKVTIAVSKTIHVTTNGGKYGNAGSVKVNKGNVSLKAGKKFRLKAKEVKMANSDKKLRHHREVQFESSDPAVAVITKKGVIKAKKKGKCTIFAYAQSGVYKKVKVKVK